MLIINCPTCGKTANLPDTAIGKTVKCTACGNYFVIPPAYSETEITPVCAQHSEQTQPKDQVYTQQIGAATHQAHAVGESPVMGDADTASEQAGKFRDAQASTSQSEQSMNPGMAKEIRAKAEQMVRDNPEMDMADAMRQARRELVPAPKVKVPERPEPSAVSEQAGAVKDDKAGLSPETQAYVNRLAPPETMVQTSKATEVTPSPPPTSTDKLATKEAVVWEQLIGTDTKLKEVNPVLRIATILLVLVAAGVLFGATGRHHYSYYSALRLLTCSAALVLAWRASVQGVKWAWVFVLLAILFNPIAPIHLSREVWQFIDAATAVVMLLAVGIIEIIPSLRKR